jgi:hypothetical protein
MRPRRWRNQRSHDDHGHAEPDDDRSGGTDRRGGIPRIDRGQRIQRDEVQTVEMRLLIVECDRRRHVLLTDVAELPVARGGEKTVVAVSVERPAWSTPEMA